MRSLGARQDSGDFFIFGAWGGNESRETMGGDKKESGNESVKDEAYL
jgi:hypothetical protein